MADDYLKPSKKALSGGVRMLVLGIVIAAVVGAVYLKHRQQDAAPVSTTPSAVSVDTSKTQIPAPVLPSPPELVSSRPKLLDLGSVTCIPCKLMAPILKNLQDKYGGRLAVEFIDVQVKPEAAQTYGISLIPTQIFFDSSGKELFRHEGFFSEEDILKKWKELGVDFASSAEPIAQPAR